MLVTYVIQAGHPNIQVSTDSRHETRIRTRLVTSRNQFLNTSLTLAMQSFKLGAGPFGLPLPNNRFMVDVDLT